MQAGHFRKNIRASRGGEIMKTIAFYLKSISVVVAMIFAVLYALNVVEFEHAAFMMLLGILNNLGAQEAAE